ncbi:MAG: NAD(P)-dependent oxidoreductase [Chloroflexi bacterium]|nr:NAD(P)-dependent oxidoreductase [Chloroflexota bacterium]
MQPDSAPSNLVLVTGAPGWVGIRLVRSLVEGLPDVERFRQPDPERTIRCLVAPGVDATPLRALSERIEIVPGDLQDSAAVRALCKNGAGATLIHCAGVIHPEKRLRELFQVNVLGTRQVMQAAEMAGIRRAVVVSSNSPFGTNPSRQHLFDESSPYHPYLEYGRTKMLMEQLVRSYHARGVFEVVVVRPPWFYGPDQPPRQTLFFTMIRHGRVPIVGDGNNRRSMAYVDNLCQGLLLAASVPEASGQTYWIADRRPYTMNKIVDTVERLLEEEFGFWVTHRRLRVPSIVGDVAYLADSLIQRAGYYNQKIHVLSEMNRSIACSIAKAERELGYDPKIELEEGMRRSIAWCIAAGLAL